MVTRIETRFGSQPNVGNDWVQVAGPVPALKTWNVSAIVSNHNVAAAALSLGIMDVTGFDPAVGAAYPATAFVGAAGKAIAVSADGLWLAEGCITTLPRLAVRRVGGGIGGTVTISTAPNDVQSLAWAPNGKYLAVGEAASGTVDIYELVADATTPRLNRLTTFTAGAAAVLAVEWSSDSAYIFTGVAATPFIQAWPFTYPATVGAAVANPATLPPGQVNFIDINPAGTFVAVGSNTTPFVRIYAWTGTAWGAASANPGTLPGGNVSCVRWNPAGTYLLVTQDVTPWVAAYAIAAGLFGTRTVPAVTTGTTSYACRWSPDGTLVALLTDTALTVQLQTFAAGLFTASANVTTALQPGTLGYAMDINPRSGGLFYTATATPWVGGAPLRRGPLGARMRAMVASGTTIAIGARAKFSGFVMNAGEVLVAQSSVVDSLDIIASGVEIT